MKIFRNPDDLHITRATAVTVGTFDGFHRGHQAILQRLGEVADAGKFPRMIVTFDPHPRKVVAGAGSDVRILTTTEEKLSIFAGEKIDLVLVIPFTRDFAQYSSGEFVRQILVKRLSLAEMVIGYDHHFGHNREGGFAELQEMGRRYRFNVHQVPQFSVDGTLVSSTVIRRYLQAGEVAAAGELMGRPYRLQGQVVRGEGRGRTIGFPTANIQVDDADKLIPGRGVYAVDVTVDERTCKGMMNIGVRPTFEYESLTLEAHLFNFDDDLYDTRIDVGFKRFIRPEKRFSGPEALREQLAKDRIACERL